MEGRDTVLDSAERADVKTNRIGIHNLPYAFEPSVLGDDGWFLELLRTQPSKLSLLKFDRESCTCAIVKYYTWKNETILAPEEDDFTRHIEFPSGFSLYENETETDLLAQIEKFLLLSLDVEPRHRFLLACFVLSSWLIDCLPIAPYVAFVGLPQSGKTTALKILRLICRRGLLTSDVSSAAFYQVCERLSPTLLIDEAATAGQQRALFHLLRSGSMRENIVLRAGESYRIFGAKAMTFRELPQDEALSSRCVVIPMRETSQVNLLRPTAPAVIRAADELQKKLVVFRFCRHHLPPSSQVKGTHLLRSRDRDLYESLVYAIGDELEPARRLLKYFLDVQGSNREPLPTREAVVLETLFELIHIHPEANFAIRSVTQQVNEKLAESGERFRLSERAVGAVLTTLGFRDRKRINIGYSVCLDRKGSRRIHELMSTYGLDALSAYLPKEQAEDPCEDCQSAARLNECFEQSDSQIGEWIVTEEQLRQFSAERRSYEHDVLAPADFQEFQSDGGIPHSEEPNGGSESVSKFPSIDKPSSNIKYGKESTAAEPTTPDASVNSVPGIGSPAASSPSADGGTPKGNNHPPKSTETKQTGSIDLGELSDEMAREMVLETMREEDRRLRDPSGVYQDESPPDKDEPSDEDEEFEAHEPSDEMGPDDETSEEKEEDDPPSKDS